MKPVTSTPTRTALDEAIASRANAQKKVEVAKEREARGRELLEDAKRKLGSFDGIDADIIKHRSGRFRKAALAGGSPDTKLPDDLAARRQQRNEASEVVAGAAAAHQGLAAELADAQTTLGAAEKMVADCASKIISEKAGALATELQTLWSRIWSLADEISAMGAFTQLPPNALSTINEFAARDFRQLFLVIATSGSSKAASDGGNGINRFVQVVIMNSMAHFASAAIEPRRVIAA